VAPDRRAGNRDSFRINPLMADGGLHDQLAAYALDALDDRERSAFESHLAECESCRAELDEFRETAALLAYAAEAPAPPDVLRERVLEAARNERPSQSVVVLRPRRALRLTAIAAAAAVAAAIGLGVWAGTLSSSLDAERSARAAEARAAAILADADATRMPLGERGELVRGPDGNAVLVVRNLPAAPAGKTYEAWVIDSGGPVKAGLFEGGRQQIVLLEQPVAKGALVAVTLEPEGGSDQPTGDILFGSGAA
jgi:anti-sigma factor RsiW